MYIYIYVYMYVYIYIKAFKKKKQLYFSLFRNLLKTALNKKCKNYIYLKHSKNTKEQLKIE